MRWRRALGTGFLVVAAGIGAAAWFAAGVIERRIARELQARGAAKGLTVGTVQFSWVRPLRLSGLTLSSEGMRLSADEARLGWTFAGGADERAHLRHVALRGVHVERGALAVEWPEADLDVVAWTASAGEEHVHVRQPATAGEGEVRWRSVSGADEAAIALRGFDLSTARVLFGGESVLVPGIWTGTLKLARRGAHAESEAALSATALRVALPRVFANGNGEYGVPTSVALAWAVTREALTVDVRRLTARVGGLELSGHGRVSGAETDRTVDLALEARSDLASALQTTALHLPAALPVQAGDRLGTAWFDVSVQGPLARPADLRIVPHLRYESTPQVSEKLEFLRRPFRYRPPDTEGVTLDVREGAADFVPLSQVPPLFLRALLISEDAGFYGHPGIDVAEIPLAWATNLERGTSARGASTITQQLVKNLFLSKDKSYGRKLEEAALSLLVDAAVPKTRILEIYVNVIEWGPGIYGLVPAARHYFGKAPSELTTREMVFLVCIIPGPVRYHQAHEAGHVGPGMDQIMANLLAKLRSVDALDDDQYFDALTEELRFAPENTV
jgi:penicillin-binding protein 1A